MDIDLSEDEEEHLKHYGNIPISHNEIIQNCDFGDENMIPPSSGLNKSVIEYEPEPAPVTAPMDENNTTERGIKTKPFPTVLKIMEGALVGYIKYTDFEKFTETPDQRKTTGPPTMAVVAKRLATQENKLLDEKQYMTYEIICCTFLLELLRDAQDDTTSLYNSMQTALKKDTDDTTAQSLEEQLLARGGEHQLRLFLTGPAGAGKTTALKAAEQFCLEFCSYCGIPWFKTTFFYTAYTGAAASAFGGRTIVTASGLHSANIETGQMEEWKRCKILVIDEISFMSESELTLLDLRLRRYKNRNKVYGGFSVIFCGDFRQLQSNGDRRELLYSRDSQRKFESNLSGMIILENKHRFKDDPEYGQLLTNFWKGDLSEQERETINSREVNGTSVTIPDVLSSDKDWSYACPYNKERNAISSGIFKRHIERTHPKTEDDELPPNHTIIIEGHFLTKSANGSEPQKIRNVIRHRIVTTCGDNDIEYGNRKKADPALCLYAGINLICVTNNKDMEQNPPRGNGTVVKFISAKIKQHANSHRWKDYNGRKVWTVNAIDVEYITVELIDNPEEINGIKREIEATKHDNTIDKKKKQQKLKELNQRLTSKTKQRQFQIKPEKRTVSINLKVHRGSTIRNKYTYQMLVFPVNICTAITGHKLQGRSKDILIVSSWPKLQGKSAFINWEYTVLSRVRTLQGLYTFEKLDLHRSYAPTEELQRFIKRAEKSEAKLIRKRETLSNNP